MKACECGRECGSKKSWIAHRAVCKSAGVRKYYTFNNREGQKVELRGDLTIEDMVRMGWSDFRIVRPDTPIGENQWRCSGG